MNASRHSAAVILCVNDQDDALELRKRVLEKFGYSVLTATNASKALEILRGVNVDLVLTDHMMPSARGTALAGEMKALKPEVPVAILSGLMEEPEDMHSADMFISKALPIPELIEKIEQLLGSGPSRLQA